VSSAYQKKFKITFGSFCVALQSIVKKFIGSRVIRFLKSCDFYVYDEVLDISLEFNLEPIVLIDYVDVSRFDNDNEDEIEEEEEDFDMDSLVNEITGW